MQAGFAFVEAGSVRSKNTINILFKNLLDTCVGCIAFWVCGFAFSGPGNAFIGSKCFLLIGCEHHYLRDWFIQFVFSVTASTIVSGAMAERTEFVSYLLYTALSTGHPVCKSRERYRYCTESFLTGFVQPIVAHWVWSPDGWLKKGVENNGETVIFKDFAGSSVVHIVGGIAAFMGAAIVGARLGRFDEAGQCVPIRGHTVTLSALGVFILFFGFFAFNITALRSLTEEGADITMGRIVVNTALSGSTGALAALVLQRWVGRRHIRGRGWSLLTALNGSLTGLVQ
jgi:Amt family ammonium transporter